MKNEQLPKSGETMQNSMFTEVTDSRVRNRNRAVMMSNLFEDNVPRGKSTTSARGGALVMQYFSRVPDEDKGKVLEDYKLVMQERGFVGE
jgi:hypothetical protein